MSDSNEAPKFPAIRALDDPDAWDDGCAGCGCCGAYQAQIKIGERYLDPSEYRELLKSEFLAVGTAQAAALKAAQEMVQRQGRIIENLRRFVPEADFDAEFSELN